MNTTVTPPSWIDPPLAASAHPVWAAAAVLMICLLAICAAAIRVNLLAEPLAKRVHSSKSGQDKFDAKPAIAGIEAARSATK